MNTRKRYSNKQIAQALNDKFGKVCEAAAEIGCHPDTIYERAKTSRAVARALRYTRQRLLDNAEQGLDYHVEMQEPWAIKFVLKTLGKHRGYSERPLPPEPESPLPPARPRLNVSVNPADLPRLPCDSGPTRDRHRLGVDSGESNPQIPAGDDSQTAACEPIARSAGRREG
ncbi:MAG: hypothetical protein ACT4QC_14345 [Planctomycetaceae bacterium]